MYSIATIHLGQVLHGCDLIFLLGAVLGLFCVSAISLRITDILASLEYAVAVLKAPLILVLCHTSCGAIEAAIKAYTQNPTYPGHIQSLTTALAPAVREASKTVNAEGLVSAATTANVQINVEKLKESNPILSECVSKGQLKIVGGIYDLSTGRVEFL